MTCKNCGGDMSGDGYTTPYCCETLSIVNGQLEVEETGTTLIFEPDCNPVYCSVIDEEIERTKKLNADADKSHARALRQALIGMRTTFSLLMYTPENAKFMLKSGTNHDAGGVMDHLASLIDSLEQETR